MFWLEALSLMKSLPDGIVMIIKLENWIKVSHIVILRMPLGEDSTNINKVGESPNVHAFIHDARRFALHNRSIIKQAPL
jgi:hypothetical protein